MNTIRMTSSQLGALKSGLMDDAGRESAAILTAGFFENGQGIHLTARSLLFPGAGDYEARTASRLRMSPLFLNRALGAAEADGITVIQSHTHPLPGGRLEYSASDLAGERESSGTVRRCLGDRPMGSLLLGPDDVIGRVWTADGRVEPVDQLRIVDRHAQFRPIGGRPRAPARVDAGLYDRQIRAFGLDGQRALSGVGIGIVGVGGTGSSVAEQLAREGVMRFTLVDHDTFDPSNRTRMYGTDAGTERRPKVEIVGANIKRISPGSAVEEVCADVVSQESLALLGECDAVFSCTDRHRPRSILNELAHQMFIPVIDVGVGVDSSGGRVSGASMRVNLVSPSLPCLHCAGVISPDRILAESLGPGDRGNRERRGYVEGIEDAAPSVVSLTTMAAGLAVFLLKDMLFKVAGSDACMVVANMGDLTAQTLSPRVRPDCVCSLRSGMGGCMPMSAPRRGEGQR